MKHTRRGFFATLLAAVAAPLVAKVIPKRKTTGTLFDPHVDIAAQYLKYRCAVGTGYLSPYYDPDVPMLELWPKPAMPQELQNAIKLREYFVRKHLEIIEAQHADDLKFLSGENWFEGPRIGKTINVRTPLLYLGLTSPTSAPASDPLSRQS